jgi:hypothetical protein
MARVQEQRKGRAVRWILQQSLEVHAKGAILSRIGKTAENIELAESDLEQENLLLEQMLSACKVNAYISSPDSLKLGKEKRPERLVAYKKKLFDGSFLAFTF